MKYLKALGGVIAAIVLGAIGSGVWEKLLSPFLSYVSEQFVRFVSSVSASYSDSIYRQAASLEGDANLNSAHWLFLLLISIALFFSVLRAKKDHPFVGRLLGIHRKIFTSWVSLIMAYALVIALVMASSTDTKIYKVRSQSLENIEIVRPYIEEKEYLEIRSQYLQVKTKKQYFAFVEKVAQIAQANGVVLESQ